MPWQGLGALLNICWAETKLCCKQSLSIASKGKDRILIPSVIICVRCRCNQVTKTHDQGKQAVGMSGHTTWFAFFLMISWRTGIVQSDLSSLVGYWEAVLKMLLLNAMCVRPLPTVPLSLLNNLISVTFIEHLLYARQHFGREYTDSSNTKAVPFRGSQSGGRDKWTRNRFTSLQLIFPIIKWE